jgi:hypothetical protein
MTGDRQAPRASRDHALVASACSNSTARGTNGCDERAGAASQTIRLAASSTAARRRIGG